MLSEVQRARYLTLVFCFCSPQAQSPRVGAASEPQRVATAPSPAGHRPALRDGRFMESPLSLRACIGTMNLSNAVGARLCEPQRVATAPSPAGHRPALRDGRFMERSEEH